MKYRRCTDNELENFCLARGIDFKPFPTNLSGRQLRQSGREHRRALIQSLKHDDANLKPFRFLDLSAELRTAVYENLLVFDDSFGCHPQILETSRQVNDEATNILYGDNLVEVKIWSDAMYAHGKQVVEGWPDFLRKAQFMRVSYGTQNTTYNTVDERTSLCAWNFTSLCEFLSYEHRLRSMKINFVQAPLGGAHFDSPFDTYALRMLGPLKECVVEGINGILIDNRNEAQLPLRLTGPSGSEDAAWQKFYEDCLEQWDDFLVKCHQVSLSRDLHNQASRMVAELILYDIEEAVGKLLQLGHVKQPHMIRQSHQRRVRAKYDTRLEAQSAFYGGFLPFSNDLGQLTVRRRITRDFPAFLGEFEKFCIDARIALLLSEEWE